MERDDDDDDEERRRRVKNYLEIRIIFRIKKP